MADDSDPPMEPVVSVDPISPKGLRIIPSIHFTTAWSFQNIYLIYFIDVSTFCVQWISVILFVINFIYHSNNYVLCLIGGKRKEDLIPRRKCDLLALNIISLRIIRFLGRKGGLLSTESLWESDSRLFPNLCLYGRCCFHTRYSDIIVPLRFLFGFEDLFIFLTISFAGYEEIICVRMYLYVANELSFNSFKTLRLNSKIFILPSI